MKVDGTKEAVEGETTVEANVSKPRNTLRYGIEGLTVLGTRQSPC